MTSRIVHRVTSAAAVVVIATCLVACEDKGTGEPSRPITQTRPPAAAPVKEAMTPDAGAGAGSRSPGTTQPGAATRPATVEMGARSTTVTPAAPTSPPPVTPSDAPPIRPAPGAGADNTNQGDTASFVGLSGPKPVTWQYRQPDPTKTMRKAEYSVPGVDGASQADIIVFQFPGGGSVEDNINRWRGQVQDADGKPAEPKVESFEADGMKITVAELAGAYRGMGATAAAPDSILIASMIETPGSPVFVQLAGPSKTVAANREAFLAMLRGIKKTEAMK
jgi:hypothetical protein